MARLYRRWDTPRSLFGDIVVLTFFLTQCLDGGFTYVGGHLMLLTTIYVVCAIVPGRRCS